MRINLFKTFIVWLLFLPAVALTATPHVHFDFETSKSWSWISSTPSNWTNSVDLVASWYVWSGINTTANTWGIHTFSNWSAFTKTTFCFWIKPDWSPSNSHWDAHPFGYRWSHPWLEFDSWSIKAVSSQVVATWTDWNHICLQGTSSTNYEWYANGDPTGITDTSSAGYYNSSNTFALEFDDNRFIDEIIIYTWDVTSWDIKDLYDSYFTSEEYPVCWSSFYLSYDVSNLPDEFTNNWSWTIIDSAFSGDFSIVCSWDATSISGLAYNSALDQYQWECISDNETTVECNTEYRDFLTCTTQSVSNSDFVITWHTIEYYISYDNWQTIDCGATPWNWLLNVSWSSTILDLLTWKVLYSQEDHQQTFELWETASRTNTLCFDALPVPWIYSNYWFLNQNLFDAYDNRIPSTNQVSININPDKIYTTDWLAWSTTHKESTISYNTWSWNRYCIGSENWFWYRNISINGNSFQKHTNPNSATNTQDFDNQYFQFWEWRLYDNIILYDWLLSTADLAQQAWNLIYTWINDLSAFWNLTCWSYEDSLIDLSDPPIELDRPSWSYSEASNWATWDIDNLCTGYQSTDNLYITYKYNNITSNYEWSCIDFTILDIIEDEDRYNDLTIEDQIAYIPDVSCVASASNLDFPICWTLDWYQTQYSDIVNDWIPMIDSNASPQACQNGYATGGGWTTPVLYEWSCDMTGWTYIASCSMYVWTELWSSGYNYTNITDGSFPVAWPLNNYWPILQQILEWQGVNVNENILTTIWIAGWPMTAIFSPINKLLWRIVWVNQIFSLLRSLTIMPPSETVTLSLSLWSIGWVSIEDKQQTITQFSQTTCFTDEWWTNETCEITWPFLWTSDWSKQILMSPAKQFFWIITPFLLSIAYTISTISFWILFLFFPFTFFYAWIIFIHKSLITEPVDTSSTISIIAYWIFLSLLIALSLSIITVIAPFFVEFFNWFKQWLYNTFMVITDILSPWSTFTFFRTVQVFSTATIWIMIAFIIYELTKR